MNDPFIKSGRKASARGARRAPGRAASIAEAAARVFTRQGWRLAQVADVAREAGVAAGTVYLYAADKAGLLDLALRAVARLPMPEEAELPIAAAVEDRLAEAIAARFATPRISAVAEGAPAGADTLGELTAELYDLLARERRLVLLLDSLSREVPAIAEAYGAGVRARGLAGFGAAMRRLAAAGLVRRDLDPALASRGVLEMIAWMAMRRPGDALPPLGDEAAARAATLALAVAALAPR